MLSLCEAPQSGRAARHWASPKVLARGLQFRVRLAALSLSLLCLWGGVPWGSLAWLSAATVWRPRPGSLLTSDLPLRGILTASCFPPLGDRGGLLTEMPGVQWGRRPAEPWAGPHHRSSCVAVTLLPRIPLVFKMLHESPSIFSILFFFFFFLIYM